MPSGEVISRSRSVEAPLPTPVSTETGGVSVEEIEPNPVPVSGLADLAPKEATALFAPPPPIADDEAIIDEQSAPPALLNEDEVIVEEQFFEMPPAPEPVSPLAPITQPIQVSPPPGELPMARTAPSAPGALPRLDVSLAGQSNGEVPTTLSETAPHQGRTRVVLPKLGAELPGNAPADFLQSVPPANSVPPVPVPLVPPPSLSTEPLLEPTFETEAVAPVDSHPLPDETEDPSFQGTELETAAESYSGSPLLDQALLDQEEEGPLGDDLDEVTGIENLAPSHGSVLPVDPSLEAGRYLSIPIPPAESEPRSLDDLEEGNETWEPLEDGDPLLESGFDPYADGPDHGGWPGEEEGETREAPRIGTVEIPEPVSLQIPADEDDEIPLVDRLPRQETDMVAVGAQEGSFLPPPVNEEDNSPENPLHEGSFGRLFAQQAPPEHRAPGPLGGSYDYDDRRAAASPSMPVPGEGDILDELFASPSGRTPGERRRLSKTAILLISTVVGVALFTVIAVVVAVNVFLGGFGVSDSNGNGEEPPLASGGDDTQVVKPVGASLPATIQDPGIGDAPAIIDQPATMRSPGNSSGASGGLSGPGAGVPSDPPAVAFDEKVQRAVNGSSGGSVIGAPALDLIDRPVTNFSTASTSLSSGAGSEGSPANDASTEPPSTVNGVAGAAQGTERSVDTQIENDPNYHPAESFSAPSSEDGPLGKTRDLIDAFLRAPDWETRVTYTYHGDSLQPAIEDYYKKWPYRPFPRYSLQLYQLESDTSLGGPYWVFIVSTSDKEEGFPLIVRTENGLLKVDWEIFAEFYDRHFLRFRDGLMPPPATFRLIIERFSDYFGSDKEAFAELKDYLVYQVNPPYGDLNEFSEYVFVKKDSEIAKKLEGLVPLGVEPLAVVITLDQKAFEHGVKHLVITDLITEGWFR
ncbi:MAG: hypothetical protein KDN18_24160 [Verrucomicrobiae bacterium]|nr:hypothetical protein [Verrucomicrobiae bacterium]